MLPQHCPIKSLAPQLNPRLRRSTHATRSRPPTLARPRVACVCPGVLAKDPAGDLQPVASFLMSLGLSTNQLQQLICLRPEILTSDLDAGARPLVGYLKSLGCTTAQCGEVLLAAPHLLRSGGRAALEARLDTLAAAGVGGDGVRAMLVRGHTGFLTEKGAPQEALECLSSMGFDQKQVRCARAPCACAEAPAYLL